VVIYFDLNLFLQNMKVIKLRELQIFLFKKSSFPKRLFIWLKPLHNGAQWYGKTEFQSGIFKKRWLSLTSLLKYT